MNIADVSMGSINYLTSYYLSSQGPQLELEESFISRCMASIAGAAENLDSDEDASLSILQRALLLLKSHLEAFHRR